MNGLDIQIFANTCTNISFIPETVCQEFKIDIDASKKRKITGASGERETAGMAREVLIELAPGCIIRENCTVIPDYPHREIGLSRTCLKRYNYDLHEFREHVALTCNEKNFFILIVPDENRSIDD